MTDTAIGYLFSRFFRTIGSFFRDWYGRGTLWFLHRWVNTLEDFDQYFAVRVTLRHFFEPLYKDYSVIGRILGFFFRSARVLLGGVIYAMISLLFIAAFLVWLAVPAWLLWSTISGLLLQ